MIVTLLQGSDWNMYGFELFCYMQLFFILLGVQGSGKNTVLKLINILEKLITVHIICLLFVATIQNITTTHIIWFQE